MPTEPPPLIQNPAEQKVPAVLARKDDSSKFDFHKVFAAVGLILTVVILIIGGLWITLQNLEKKVNDLEDDLVIVTKKPIPDSTEATTSANQASKSATPSAN